MELRDGIFAVKLCELEHQYGLLRSRLSCARARTTKGSGVCWERSWRRSGRMACCWSGARGAPAPRRRRSWRRPQRDYVRRVESILREEAAPPPAGRGAPERRSRQRRRLSSRSTPSDFAGQAARGALAAALTAMDQQMSCEEERKERPV